MRIFRNPCLHAEGRFGTQAWMKLLLVVLFFAGIFLILRYLNIDFSRITLESFKDKINSLGVWGPVVYIIFYLLRPLILFPASLLSASAGVIWGLKGLMYLLIAAYISSVVEFFIARYFARQAVEKLIEQSGSFFDLPTAHPEERSDEGSHEILQPCGLQDDPSEGNKKKKSPMGQLIKGKISNLDEKIAKHGFLTVLLVRLIPNVAWDIQNLALGITKVKFRDYFLATLIGIMPGSFALVYFGTSVINVLTNPKNFWMIIVAVLIFAGVYILQKYLRKTKP